jgi:hypothetical protein
MLGEVEGVWVGPGRGARPARVPGPATAEELAGFETDVLAGFVLARASAGLVDSTIRNDTNHLELIRDWFGRPLWEMQPPDADAYFGKVLRDAKPSTRAARPRRGRGAPRRRHASAPGRHGARHRHGGRRSRGGRRASPGARAHRVRPPAPAIGLLSRLVRQRPRAVHRALAEATDPETGPDRRAWHRARATPGPDEEVATELERSADRAQARGGLAAAAAFLRRAVALTVDPVGRVDRALAAGQASQRTGAFGAARELVATAETGLPLDESQRARADVLRGELAFASGLDSDTAGCCWRPRGGSKRTILTSRARPTSPPGAPRSTPGISRGAQCCRRSAAPSSPFLPRRAHLVPWTCCSTASPC